MFKQKKSIFVLKPVSYSMFLLHIGLLFSTHIKQTTVQPDAGFINIFFTSNTYKHVFK